MNTIKQKRKRPCKKQERKKHCAVIGCGNNKDSLSYFTLPKEDERRSKWVKLIGRENSANKTFSIHSVVCEEHFEKSVVKQGKVRKTLINSALPSLKLPDLNNAYKYPVFEFEIELRKSKFEKIVTAINQPKQADGEYSQSATTYTHRKRSLDSDLETTKNNNTSDSDSETEDLLENITSQSIKSNTHIKRGLQSDPSENREKMKNFISDSATEKTDENDDDDQNLLYLPLLSNIQSIQKIELDSNESNKKAKNFIRDSETEKSEESYVDILDSENSQSSYSAAQIKRQLESDSSETTKTVNNSINSATEKPNENYVDLESQLPLTLISKEQVKQKLESNSHESRKKVMNFICDSETEKSEENYVDTVKSQRSQSLKVKTKFIDQKIQFYLTESRKKQEKSISDSTTKKSKENYFDILENLNSEFSKRDKNMKRKIESETSVSSKKLKGSNDDCATQIIQENDFHELCDQFLSEELSELVKAQAYVRLKNSKSGCDYNHKIFCLNLYYTCPRAYRLLQGAICLPNIETLITCKIPVTTKINESLFTILKSKVQAMTDKEKICSVTIDAMSLKPNLYYNITQDKIIGFQEIDGVQSPKPANYAMVVMVRGIVVDWMQPVGYALLFDHKDYGEVAKWIDKILERLLNIELNVKTFASGMGSDLNTVAKDRSVTIERPYFLINNRKIYYIFDAPHLIHLVHKNLTSYHFHFDDCVATHEDITTFYVKDKQSRFRLAPKLTSKHILATNDKKMKVHASAQVLSNSVATGISTYIDFKIMDESGKDTAELIKLMNDLFDVLNSSSVKDSCKYKRAYCGKKYQQIFLNKMLVFFDQLKLKDSKASQDVTSNVKFIEAFQITIKAIMLLFEDLKAEGCKYLLTRRLNQDVLDVFFGRIRKNTDKTDPTSRQFVQTFQKLFISSLKKPPVVECDKYNLGKFLIHTSALDLPNQEVVNREKNSLLAKLLGRLNVEHSSQVQIRQSEYNRLQVPKKDSLIFISTFLLKRCSERHSNCAIFRAYLHPDPMCFNIAYSKYKDYLEQGGRKLIVIPADTFLQYVEKMQEVFHNYIQKDHPRDKFSEAVYGELNEIYFLIPCPCFPLTYLKKLFIRMKIFQSLSLINRLFKLKSKGY